MGLGRADSRAQKRALPWQKVQRRKSRGPCGAVAAGIGLTRLMQYGKVTDQNEPADADVSDDDIV